MVVMQRSVELYSFTHSGGTSDQISPLTTTEWVLLRGTASVSASGSSPFAPTSGLDSNLQKCLMANIVN